MRTKRFFLAALAVSFALAGCVKEDIYRGVRVEEDEIMLSAEADDWGEGATAGEQDIFANQ